MRLQMLSFDCMVSHAAIDIGAVNTDTHSITLSITLNHLSILKEFLRSSRLGAGTGAQPLQNMKFSGRGNAPRACPVTLAARDS